MRVLSFVTQWENQYQHIALYSSFLSCRISSSCFFALFSLFFSHSFVCFLPVPVFLLSIISFSCFLSVLTIG